MHSLNLGFQLKFATPALALMPVTLYLLMHDNHGLSGDRQIYAFQAFAKFSPELSSDLYLQNTSHSYHEEIGGST
jgi:hypothetical protein